MTQDSRPCFAHRHMTLKEFGLWNYLRSVSHKSGLVHFDGRQIATQFHGVSKSTIYRVRDSLGTGGWLVMTKGPKKMATGVYSSGEFRALSHDEWAKLHPGLCNVEADWIPEAYRNDTGQPVPFQAQVQSHGRDKPVPPAGHNLILNLYPSCILREAPDRKLAKDLPYGFEANASNRQYALSMNLDIVPIVEDFTTIFGVVGNKRRNWQAVLRKFIDQVSQDCSCGSTYLLPRKTTQEPARAG